MKMKRRLLVVIFHVLVITALTSRVLAEDVFITRTGKYYYPATSPFIKTRATIRVSREEAEMKGFKPSKSYLKENAMAGRAPAAKQEQ